MYADLMLTVGGIGLFLLGMILLTGGLRELAGNTLRRLLGRFTDTPLKGAVAGAFATAIVQSSSATTVTAVGFVSAGLITFPQALGIVFGANIGTTITGWLVALLGFKLNLGTAVLPLVPAGVLMRMFGHRQVGAIGWAIAGFGVLFIGIDAMQEGMSNLEGLVTPDHFPNDTFAGRFLLVLFGILITLVTQSSSAGVATALTALAAGAISFPQAAAMVIGMDVGTTFTAALATVGGSSATRRTGFAHVVYNLITGFFAFFLLDAYTAILASWTTLSSVTDAQFALVGFHTTFNFIGVILVLPFAGPFARLIVRMFPERSPYLVRLLDDKLLQDAALAIPTASATSREIYRHLLTTVYNLLEPSRGGMAEQNRLSASTEALDQTRRFIEQARIDPADQKTHRQYTTTLHILDHLQRLTHRCLQPERIVALQGDHRLRRLTAILRHELGKMISEELPDRNTVDRLDRIRRLMRRQRHSYRENAMSTSYHRKIDMGLLILRLDAVRWLQRVAYHLWRLAFHVSKLSEGDGSASPAVEGAAETAVG